MNALYIITGAALGLMAGGFTGHPLLGLFSGLLIGILFARLEKLQKRVDELSRQAGFQPRRKARVEAVTTEAPGTEDEEAVPGTLATPEPSKEDLPEPVPAAAGTTAAGMFEAERPAIYKPSPLENLFTRAKGWMTTGNVPVKVGVLLSFIGVSFLLKYAIDRNLLNLPIELRLLGVALAGAVLMLIGWRLREKRRVYALSLQGGGAGILFLTVYAALRIWQLMPPAAAFFLLFLLAALTAFLAVSQNARILALFGVIGGFLAPLLTSTGQGSHVVLFSYYLVINLAILGIAWFRAWRELNLVGFVFTFVISTFWGYHYFKPELFASTEPFLLLFFLFYQAIAILYALRQPPDKPGIVDGTLVFGTPIIVFALQNALLHDTEYGLAISAAVLAVFYGLCTALLRRRGGKYPVLLSEAFLALAVGFATLAIPLALDAHWTSAAWALEGAGLVWVGVRQGRHLANLAGFALVFLSGLFFLHGGWSHDAGLVVINGNVLGGLIISLAALFVSSRLQAFKAAGDFTWAYRLAALCSFTWGVLWWLGTGWMEVLDRAPYAHNLPLIVLFTAASATLAAWLGRIRSWQSLQSATLAHLPLLLPFALLALLDDGHFLHGAGWLAWPMALAVQLYVLYETDKRNSRFAATWHLASLALATAVLALEVHWWVDRVASVDWAAAAAVSVTGLVAILLWRCRRRPAWPVPLHDTAYLSAFLVLVSLQAIAMALLSMARPGDPGPLHYIPVLNPFDLGMIFSMLTTTIAWRIYQRSIVEKDNILSEDGFRTLRIVFAGAFFIMTTAALVRAVHHFSGVPWQFDRLFDSVIVQTSLSIYWGLLGFTGMVLGARKQRRMLWMIGAGFMALVVIKLFLVDLGNTGTVERIVSFIGTGALLLVVGYFAPAPPKPEG
ncbi:MAG: DUF2339 domain-containing protein [Xanthomonadales bacterium]|jgi:uncharacterized membrane protein|nr:DUF2339 domain-containing protein [Xanthomonadales bacterium]